MDFQAALEFFKNLPSGAKYAGVVLFLAVIRRGMKSKKIRKRLGKWADDLGATVSVMLRGYLGAKIENIIELFFIDMREIIGHILDSFIHGLRKDNKKREKVVKAKIEKKEKQKSEKIAKIAEKTAIKKNNAKLRNLRNKSR